jgi:protein-S-isoprenylcysteine O-methyltransferase Ste14
MTLVEKLKADGLPIALFAVIVGGKVYSLWTYLTGNPALFGMLKNIDSVAAYGPGAAMYLTSGLSYLLYFVTATAFDALVLYSFIVRGAAKSRPEGVVENVLPLVTVFVPVIGFTLLFFPQVRALVPGYSQETLQALAALSPRYGFYMNLIGFALGFVGVVFSIWSISHLKRSFGLRAAVRTLVTSGPYSRIRHPLYLGEIVHILGIAILSATPVGLYLFAGALLLQILRAKVEERKFLRTLSEYADYMQRTGFLLPRFSRP